MRAHLPIFLAVVAVAVGCAGIQTRVRRDGHVVAGTVRGRAAAAARRAHREIPCSYDEMVVEDLSGGGVRVAGCGAVITYTCIADVCDPRERSSTMMTPGPVRGGSTWSDTQVRQLHASIHEPVTQCLPAGTDTLRLQLAISPQGQVRRIGRSAVEPSVAACVGAVLASGRMAGTAVETRFVVMDFRRGAAPAQPLAPATPESAPGSPAVMPATTQAAARAAIDSRAAGILACVEADALSMQVSWSSDGRLDALLRGERQGTPEEACVRAIVQQLAVPAPGGLGTIVHAIQR